MSFFISDFNSLIFNILKLHYFIVGLRYPLISIIYLSFHCTFVVISLHFFAYFFEVIFVNLMKINLHINFVYLVIFDCNFVFDTDHYFNKCLHQFSANFNFAYICLLITIGCLDQIKDFLWCFHYFLKIIVHHLIL